MAVRVVLWFEPREHADVQHVLRPLGPVLLFPVVPDEPTDAPVELLGAERGHARVGQPVVHLSQEAVHVSAAFSTVGGFRSPPARLARGLGLRAAEASLGLQGDLLGTGSPAAK